MSVLYSSGVINIPNVTGNIVITATATAAPVNSISATYTQSGTVYNTDSLDSLKDDLVVTASYEGGTSGIVDEEDYTLSGTLTVGTSTVTVTYSGKTTTFTVTVSQFVNGLVNGTYTNSPPQITVLDNVLNYDADGGSYKNIDIPFRMPISLHNGDVIQLKSTREDGSVTNTKTTPFELRNSSIGTGWISLSAVQYETNSSSTKTVSQDFSADTLRLQPNSGTVGSKFALSLLINNEVIF